MASWVSPVVAVLLIVVASSSGACGCVKCSIDREAEQDNTCVIRCYSPGKDGPSVMINGEALRTALDCNTHSIETNPYCLLRENDISVGAKIKSSSRRTLFEYNPNTELCRDKCEFSVEFNGSTCSVVSEDLSKPCIKNPPATSADPVATSTHPTATSPESTITTKSGPTEPPSVTPDNGIIGGIIEGAVAGGAGSAVVIGIIIAAVLIAVYLWKSKQKAPTTGSEHGEGEVPNVVTLKSFVKKRQ